MEWVKIILEYFKVLLSTQMVIATVVIIFLKLYNDEVKELLKRLIKLPGGVELSAPQLEKVKTEKLATDNISSVPQSAAVPASVPGENIETVKALYDSERKRAYFWEYSFLNYFLVLGTQRVLTWLASSTSPVSLSFYDSFWTPTIPDPKERQAILSALETHHLILIESELIKVNPKGLEYIEWRHKVLNPPKNI